MARVYKPRIWEGDLLVQSKENPSEYVGLEKYLKGIEDKHDRAIEKAQIEKLVDW